MLLREYLKSTKISVRKMAILANISRCYLHMIMSGAKPASKKIRARIGEITSYRVVTAEDLIDPKSLARREKASISFQSLPADLPCIDQLLQ